MNFHQFILLISNLPALVTAVLAARNLYKFEKELRIFSGFLIFNVLIQISSSAFNWFGVNNMPFLHVYTVATGYFLIYFYHQILHSYITSNFLHWLSFTYVGFSIIDSIFFESVFTFNTVSLTVLSVIIIILSLSTFNLFLIDSVKEDQRLRISGLNWINSGLFIYFSTNLILYYFGNELVNAVFPKEIAKLAWLPHVFFMTIMHICFFIGLWKSPKR